MLRKRGLDAKYERPGIYCIKLNEQIVYVGKSKNMLVRIAQHDVGIQKQSEKKYRLLSELQRNGCTIGFDVLCYAKSKSYQDLEEELGKKEGQFIRGLNPILNSQIPKAENWRFFELKEVNAQEILKQFMPNP